MGTGKQRSSKAYTYADAGVDIAAGDGFVDDIRSVVAATARPGADAAIGGFGGVFDLKATGYADPLLISATDGVGTKLKLAHQCNVHQGVGVDLVAMCVNDLVVQGAEPLFFLDYFATGKLERAVAAEVVRGIAHGCKLAGCALVGGETAEMPGMYAKGDYDLAGFAVGAVERAHLLPSPDLAEGDVVLGLMSSGPHSNGYSLIRRLVEDHGFDLFAPAPFDKTQSLGEALLTPTRIYVKSLLEVLRPKPLIKAMAHITGGGLDGNIPRVLPDNLAVTLDLAAFTRPAVFDWLCEIGQIEEREMLRTFNCGLGMVVMVAPDHANEVQETLMQAGETVVQLGQITPRDPRGGVVYL